MKTPRITRRTALAMLPGTLLAGCGRSDDGVIRIATPQFSPALADPFIGLALPDTLLLDNLYDALTVLELNGEASPALASRWTQESPRQWRFHLRPGARFSNGRPLDAPAVAAAFRLLETPRGRRTSVGSDLARVETMRAVDADTLLVRLAQPEPLLPALLSYFRIPEAGAYAALGPGAFSTRPVGSGPFALDAYSGNAMQLVAQPHPWRSPLSARVELLRTPDRTARLQAVLSRTAHAALGIAPDDRAALVSRGGRLMPRMSTSVLVFFFVETEDGPLADRRVREALNLAVDRRKLIDAFLLGSTAPANQLSSDDGFGRHPSLEPIGYAPERARALLEDAGFGNGLSLSLVAAVGAAAADSAVFQQIAADLKPLGVTLTIKRVPPATIREHLYRGNWPGDLFALRTGGFDSLRSFRLASCDWIAPWQCHPEVDAIVDAARRSTDRAERQRLTGQAIAAHREAYGALYLWQEPTFDAIGSGLEGWTATRAEIRLERLRLAV